MSHVATPTPTQIAYPWKATLRTVLQTLAGIVLGLASFISAAAIFAPQLLDAITEILPPEWVPYAAAAVAFVVLLSATVTRIMVIPGVNEFLTKLKLGAVPAASVTTPTVPLDGA